MTVADYLRTKEGFKPFVYDDATGHKVVPGYVMVGHPTIGVGRALDVMGISSQEADLLLGNDIAECTLDLHMLLQNAFDGASEARQAALVSLRFQLGPRGFRGFHEMIDAIRLGDWPGAGEEAKNSEVGRNPKTAARIAEEAAMLETGEWPQQVA